jgi:hypothetical protein
MLCFRATSENSRYAVRRGFFLPAYGVPEVFGGRRLFMSLFMGRDDVFVKRWENVKNSSAGYVPVCRSEWAAVCPKSGGGKMKGYSDHKISGKLRREGQGENH